MRARRDCRGETVTICDQKHSHHGQLVTHSEIRGDHATTMKDAVATTIYRMYRGQVVETLVGQYTCVRCSFVLGPRPKEANTGTLDDITSIVCAHIHVIHSSSSSPQQPYDM